MAPPTMSGNAAFDPNRKSSNVCYFSVHSQKVGKFLIKARLISIWGLIKNSDLKKKMFILIWDKKYVIADFQHINSQNKGFR